MSTQPSYYYNAHRPLDRRKRRGKVSATWKLTEIQSNHHRIIMLLYKGWSNRHIAQELGVSEVMVSNVKNSPAAQDKLTIMEKATEAESVDLRRDILKNVPRCQETLLKLMDNPNTSPNLKAKIAMDQLDRAGYAPVKQIESRNLHAHKYLDDNDIAELKRRGLELAEKSGILI